jgi:predicted nucleotidyltransferase
MVEFEELSPSEHADAYFGLLADLEALLPRRIDLLEKSAIENPYLLRGIERSRRLLYEAA